MWANVEEIPAWERKRVRVMTFCLARLLHPSGELALGDGGPIAVPHPGDELMAVAAVVLEEPAFALERDLPGIWPVAILGKRSRRVYQALVRAPQGGATPRALRRTGFYVLPGDEGDVMILDAAGSSSGRTGSFAFECSVGGRLLVVGPGAGGDDGHPLALVGAQPAGPQRPGRSAGLHAGARTRWQRARRVLDDARRPPLLRGDGSARDRRASPPPRVLPPGPLLDRVRRDPR